MTFDASSTTIAALVTAAGHAPEGAPTHATPIDPRVRAEIDRARVYLYCGRGAEAVTSVRAARAYLRACDGLAHTDALADLEEAAWLARSGRTESAERALERALLHAGLTAAPPSSPAA